MGNWLLMRTVRRAFWMFVSAMVTVALAGVVGATAANAQSSCHPNRPSCTRTGPQIANPNPHLLVGRPAPSLKGPNLTGSGTVSLASFAGKPVAVVFWVNTSAYDPLSMPGINGLQRELGKSAQIVSVALQWPPIIQFKTKGYETPQAATHTMGLTIPTILFKTSQVSIAHKGQWQVLETPTAFIVNSRGVVVRVIVPDASNLITAPELQSALANVR